MNCINRMLCNLVALTALAWTCVNFSAEHLLESWTFADQCGNRISLRECRITNERLSRELQSSAECCFAKDRMAEKLMAKELSLREAAACFRSLYQGRESLQVFHPALPEFHDGASWCRMVIEWTDAYARSKQSASPADVLRQRLEAELQGQLERHGDMVLSE